ncbi:Cdc6/Cdc18 family protein [Natronococcus occultus]|uniref:Transcriptional regulator n=1 Tax=Natronococcus occultus SP4 TaxID=694430 RepID=L0JW38_9EURY|nr:hypothetical protein [Natronococcus occultus]AGB36299.1 hypothetical protein Natoc_0435 [Natronococcus occultus SP4]
MVAETEFDSLSLTEQLVLLAVADAHRNDETPAQTHEVRRTCRDRLADLEGDVVGTVTEADVMRSLYRLEDEGIVEEKPVDDRSPTGKGRPRYALSEPPEEVYEGVSDRLL